MPRRHFRPVVIIAAVGLVAGLSRPAAAQGTIGSPGDHPHYSFELEPHLALSYKAGIGPGVRATIVILDNGFIRSINNSVGVGFGAEWLSYGSHCEGAPPARVCESAGDVMVPIVIQWNFWLHRMFSVFGEPGLALHFHRGPGDDFAVDPFTIFGGARAHFSDSVALTLRLGAPEIFRHDSVITIGLSLLL